MCLGIPGRVIEIHGETADTALMGRVDFGGVRKEVCLAYVPDIRVGEYTIVHVGFAITKVDEASAMETLRMFQSLGLLDEELNVVDEAAPAECPTPLAWSTPPAAGTA